MKNKKVLALLISLVLIVAVALPGTLAVSSDQDAVNSDFTVDTASPAPETQELTGGQEQPIDPENPEQPEQPETPEQPEQPVVPETQEVTGEPETPAEVPACTCDPAPLEGEEHKEGCPLYVDPNAPVVISHIETCLEDCTGEECACVCHVYEKLLACTTLDEVWAIMDAMTDEQWDALTEMQMEEIDKRIAALNVVPVPAAPEEDNNPKIESKIIYPTVNCTYVAPFVAPVTGGRG